MQPFIKDKKGTVRFKSNKLVERLLEESQKQGFGLNELACIEASQPDREQFAQLIGYSLSGYHELPYVSDESALKASASARKSFPKSGGCRDDGCEIHSGVETEKEAEGE